MATEDDNFDIDIYGDDPSQQEAAPAQQADAGGTNPEDYIDFSDDEGPPAGGPKDSAAQPNTADQLDKTSTTEAKAQDTPQPQQGTKRKADDSEYPEDQSYGYESWQQADDSYANATSITNNPYRKPALLLNELQWWTTEDDLRSYCAAAGVEDALKDVSFGEHKVNGKCWGEAYLEFESTSAADKVKVKIEEAVQSSANATGAKRKEWTVQFAEVGSGFKMPPGAPPGQQKQGQGGYHNNRGGYNDRGRGNFRGGFNRGGGYGGRGGGYQQSNPSQGGWGNNGGMGMNGGMNGMNNMGGMNGMGGHMGMGGFNPAMMANMMGMGNMGNFNGMNRGGMGMNMMGRGNMMGGNNMGMMNSGGWSGGGGFQGQQGWQGGGNKRGKMG